VCVCVCAWVYKKKDMRAIFARFRRMSREGSA
jgi:hypothetical protein